MTFKNRLLGLLLIVALFVLTLGILNSRSNSTGSVEIIFQLPDIQHLTVTLNSKALPVQTLDATYTLSTGNKHLAVNKLGYKPFSTEFTLSKGQAVIINVVMTPVLQQSQAVATQALTNSLIKSLPAGFSLQHLTYFYDNTWAVTQVSANGNTAILVMQYSLTSNTWAIVLGPGTLFDSTSVNKLPPNVSTYMYAQNYALSESFTGE